MSNKIIRFPQTRDSQLRMVLQKIGALEKRRLTKRELEFIKKYRESCPAEK